MNKFMKIILGLVIIAIIIGLSFYGGMLYKKQDRPTPPVNPAQLDTANPIATAVEPNRVAPQDMIVGKVTAMDNQSITLQLADGSTQTIFLSGTTRIGKVVTGTTDDITVGSSLAVNGTENSDGTVSAQMVQVRPQAPSKPAKRPNQQ